jgi:o-succinylbenzoate synthase
MIRVDSVSLREIHLPLVARFETSAEITSVRKIILVTARCGGCAGYGECTAGETPYYSHETTETAWHVLGDFIIPLLLGREIDRASECAALLRPIRGHRMARAALETALFELEARMLGISLFRHIGGKREEIASGVSIGIQKSLPDLLDKVRQEIKAGYRRIKIKIKPGYEHEPLAAIRNEFPDVMLMADANSAFRLSDAPLLRGLDRFRLMMIEQPLGDDDLVDHAVLQRQIETPICLDESIQSLEDARKAIELGSCRIINVKLGRVGGYSEALAIHDHCVRHQIPVWCGGMLESGIGRAHNIALSTLSGFTLPGDVSASRRYFREDTVIPPIEVTPRGTIPAPSGPGIGFELNHSLIERSTVRTREFVHS